MKQEIETGRGFRINVIHVVIVVVVSVITSFAGVFVMGRILHAQLDVQEQQMKVLREQLTLLDYRSLKLQADFLTGLRSRIIMYESDQSVQETARVKEIYNTLASKYNNSMVESNWKFTSMDSLPSGVSEPLPRAFILYSL